MNKGQLNNLDLIIRENFINPDEYPNVKKNNSLIGVIYKSYFNDSEKWISQDDYINLIQRVIKTSGDTELIIFEDFERKYKSSGKVVRLNEKISESWSNFDYFLKKTEMISFFVIGKSQDWVIWVNRDYWCIMLQKSVVKILGINISYDSNMASFRDVDEEFITFVKNLGGNIKHQKSSDKFP